VADLSGRYANVNGAGCRLLGFSREEIVGKTIVDFIPAEDVDKLGREKARLLAGETVVSEWVLRRKDGTYVPVEVSAAILPDGRWQGFVRDISERKQLAEALRAQQADLERAQSVAKVGSWRLDIRRNELSWSEESHRIFGIPPGSPLTYETFLSCVHPDDRNLVDREWRAAVAGKPYDIEHRIVVAEQIKWVREKADLEFDDQRRLVGGIGITYDVTDRKLREEELHQVRERYELALRGADLGAWDWNIQTGAVVFNARWAEMRGYRPDELRGHVDSWSSGVHPDDWPRVQMLLGDYLAGRAPEYEAELRVRTKSGEWIWVLDRGRVFERGARGEPARMVGTELDITGRKQAEERRRVAEAKASGIVSVSADAIISIDVEQRITLFNEGAEKIFGYTKAEALGAPLEMLIPERFRTVHRRDVDEFAAAGPSARKMGERGTP
jgi:PAS domain S-box-containing protein